jgi:hypothetical protein
LIGLEGGQTGGELFPGLSIVQIHHEMESWRKEGKIAYLPPHLLPINDDLGCGMVDYVDCQTAAGQIWRSDSGAIYKREPTLMTYLREAIRSYEELVQRTR